MFACQEDSSGNWCSNDGGGDGNSSSHELYRKGCAKLISLHICNGGCRGVKFWPIIENICWFVLPPSNIVASNALKIKVFYNWLLLVWHSVWTRMPLEYIWMQPLSVNTTYLFRVDSSFSVNSQFKNGIELLFGLIFVECCLFMSHKDFIKFQLVVTMTPAHVYIFFNFKMHESINVKIKYFVHEMPLCCAETASNRA